jgi:hypothetical protein
MVDNWSTISPLVKVVLSSYRPHCNRVPSLRFVFEPVPNLILVTSKNLPSRRRALSNKIKWVVMVSNVRDRKLPRRCR